MLFSYLTFKAYPYDPLHYEILKDPTAQYKAYYSYEISESALKQLGWHELPNNCRGALSLPRTANTSSWERGTHKRPWL